MDPGASFGVGEDPWALYDVIAGVDAVTSWEVLQKELLRRFDTLEAKMTALKADSRNASLTVLGLVEEQGGDWQPAAQLRQLASLKELELDIIKNKIAFEKATGRDRRRWLALRHNQTLATAEMELGAAEALVEEKTSLALESLHEEQKAVEVLGALEESRRRSTEVALLLLDVQAANQTAQLSTNRRLSESLATVRALTEAERGGEAADVARIRAKGKEARKQTQAVVDETFALVGAAVLSVSSDPLKLTRIMAGLLGLAFVSLLVGNAATLAATAVRRRLTKPRLVRETDLPGSIPAAAVAWIARRWRMLFRLSSAYGRGAPLPHILIHGATGSGKSILARRLVKMCGLNTVVVAGGDVGPLGANASAELSGLLQWAGGGGGKGVVLVMDEAEAALGDRRKKNMSENSRSALNAVLLCTGELRPGFSMVLTTSRPKDLDEAVLDRVDEVIHLPLPRLPERARLVRQYFKAYLHRDPPIDFLSAAAVTGHDNTTKKTYKVAAGHDGAEARKLANLEKNLQARKVKGVPLPPTDRLMASQPELLIGADAEGFSSTGMGVKKEIGGDNNLRSFSAAAAAAAAATTAATAQVLSPRHDSFCAGEGCGDDGSRADKGRGVRWFFSSPLLFGKGYADGWLFLTRLFSGQQLRWGKQEGAEVAEKIPHGSRPQNSGDGALAKSPSKFPDAAMSKVSFSPWLASTGLKLKVGAGKRGQHTKLQLSAGFEDNAAGLIAMFAVRSEGFYGRDMAHFFSAVQAAVYGSESCELTEQLWARTERQKLREFSEKQLMTATNTNTNTNTNINTNTIPTITNANTASSVSSNDGAQNKHRHLFPARQHPSKGTSGVITVGVEAENGKNDDHWCSKGVAFSSGRKPLLQQTEARKPRATNASDGAERDESEGALSCRGEEPSPPRDPEITHPDR
eukprot:jgi/Undpi1/9748/HiC_scaffold_27.g12204.m1